MDENTKTKMPYVHLRLSTAAEVFHDSWQIGNGLTELKAEADEMPLQPDNEVLVAYLVLSEHDRVHYQKQRFRDLVTHFMNFVTNERNQAHYKNGESDGRRRAVYDFYPSKEKPPLMPELEEFLKHTFPGFEQQMDVAPFIPGEIEDAEDNELYVKGMGRLGQLLEEVDQSRVVDTKLKEEIIKAWQMYLYHMIAHDHKLRPDYNRDTAAIERFNKVLEIEKENIVGWEGMEFALRTVFYLKATRQVLRTFENNNLFSLEDEDSLKTRKKLSAGPSLFN